MRYGWIAASVFVLVVTIGILRAFRAVPVYQAVAKTLVERQEPRIMKFDDLVQPDAWWSKDYYKTQEGLVNSRAVLERALREPALSDFVAAQAAPEARSGWERFRRTLRAMVGTAAEAPVEPWQRLQGFVYAEHVADSQFLRIKAEHTDPRRAAQIANAVARAFVDYSVSRKHDISGEAFAFLDEQRNHEEKALREAEDHLAQFRNTARNTSFDVAEEDNPVFKRLARINEELTETEIHEIELGAQLKQLESLLGQSPDEWASDNEQIFSLRIVREDQSLAEIRSQLRTAENEYARLAETYGPDHPQLQSAETARRMLRGKLRESLAEVSKSVSIQASLLGEQRQKLRTEYDDQNRRSVDLVQESVEFARLHNDVARHQKLYEMLVGRMREVDLSGSYERSNVELVEAASVPSTPIRPRKSRSILLAVLAGGLLALGVTAVLEYLDDTVRTPEDLEERVGLTVLGFVPHISGQRDAHHQGLISLSEPDSSVVEAYRNIRTSLMFSAPSEEVKTIVVTSGAAGDGKTTTSTNLALVMANSGKRVLLIDFDLRRPTVHKVFGMENVHGLSDLLIHAAEPAQCMKTPVLDGTPVHNLQVLVAGTKPPNATELIESKATRQLLEDFRPLYDRIIIDCPPVLFVSDATILSSVCDGVVLVVRSAKNARSLAVRARRQLASANARILGALLNDVTRWSQFCSEYYYYGYSRYYRDYYSSYYADEKDEVKKKRSAG